MGKIQFYTLCILVLLFALCLISPVVADTLSIKADKDSIYFGDTVTFSGSNPDSSKVYLFIMGPNLPTVGGQMTDPLWAVQPWDPSAFAHSDVHGDRTWEYKWSTADLDLDPGTYTIYAVVTPDNADNLGNTKYATQSVVIKMDTREYPQMSDNTAGEDHSTDDQPPIAITGDKIDIHSSTNNGIAYHGDKITFSGTNSNSNKVYLFITGPNLPSTGGQMIDPRTKIDINNKQTFSPVDVHADHTWSYDWQTANMNIDPGTYTIYAAATPNSKDNLTNTQYATVSVSLRKPFLNVAISKDVVARGESVSVQGTATGNPFAGIAIWIIGVNKVIYATESVNADSSFEYEIPGAVTSDLQNGEYTVIVQHPMANGIFEVYPSNDFSYVLGRYPVSGSTLFRLQGSECLPSSAAVNALLNDLNNPNIDDRYTRLKFVIGESSSQPITADYLTATVQPSTTSSGGTIYIRGSAKGSPVQGVAVWIIGNDKVIYTTVQVNKNSSFEYEISTKDLPNGNYSVIVQHPMYNGIFDVYPASSVPGQNSMGLVSGSYPFAGNTLFELQGPGSLSSSSAVAALINDLNDPNIDDGYTRLNFVVGGVSSPPNEKDYLTVNAQPLTIEPGQDITISGTAKGNPTSGVAIWIFGKNKIIYDIASVKPDSTFQDTFSASTTSNLASGEYSVVVQHPMENRKFDVWPNIGSSYGGIYVLGSYPVSGSSLFDLLGPGSLFSSSSLKALVSDLNNPNIDDRYKTLKFVVNNGTQPVGQSPVPHIDRLSVTTKNAGDPGFTLNVTGSNFTQTCKVYWNTVERTTKYNAPTTLSVTILASDIANAGIASVSVINKTTGGGTSNLISFTITNGSSSSTGSISILSTPSGATIYLDSVNQGLTPVTLNNITIGPHPVVISKTGYKDYQSTVTVSAGKNTTVNPTLTPVPGSTGSINVKSNPLGATVYLDDNNQGVTPITLNNIAKGSHALVINMTGYKDYQTSVTVTAGKTTNVNPKLQAAPVTLPTIVPTTILTIPATTPPIPTTTKTQVPTTIPTTTAPTTGSINVKSTPSGANVYLDGPKQGVTPITLNNIAEGSHAIVLTMAGYSDYQTTVTVTRGQTISINPILSPIPGSNGTIEIQTNPSGAKVYLDGLNKGITPITLYNVAGGSHTVLLTMSGYTDYQSSVAVTGNQKISIYNDFTSGHGGVIQAASNIVVKGNVYGIDETGTHANLGVIQFDLGLAAGGLPVDVTKIQMVYNSTNQLPYLVPFSPNGLVGPNSWTVTGKSEGADNMIREGQYFTIQIRPLVNLTPRQEFDLEIKPENGAALGVERTIPLGITNTTLLY